MQQRAMLQITIQKKTMQQRAMHLTAQCSS